MGTEIDKEQIEAEWKEFCETGELPEAKPRVITMPEFLKMSREEVEKRMDEIGFGGLTMEAVDENAKEQGDIEVISYIASVMFLNPHEMKGFYADTKEDMTAKINEAAKGREYVARYMGIAKFKDSTK